MENSSCVPEIERPAELLEFKKCVRVADLVLSCYFATHRSASSVALDALVELCDKLKIHYDDEITKTAA